ncbi:hypothetical protein NDU88_004878 [Pleurodeles waltl]|uniref:Uncharacterized protein n=1 Tax=Pleurodeles waltl TaxID=8319 RepID=A0AAV7MBA3_PLEWA|nr:hypothetical protein NDU88_004878 [Pleurodeles waltl]
MAPRRLEPRRKKSGVPRCGRGGGKRLGAFREGEAPRSEACASERPLPSPLRPPFPPSQQIRAERAGGPLYCRADRPRVPYTRGHGGVVALRPGAGNGPDAQRTQSDCRGGKKQGLTGAHPIQGCSAQTHRG